MASLPGELLVTRRWTHGLGLGRGGGIHVGPVHRCFLRGGRGGLWLMFGATREGEDAGAGDCYDDDFFHRCMS